MLFPISSQRVASRTSRRVNEKIADQTRRNLDYFRDHPERIDQRIAELEREWDIERAIETQAGTLALTGAALALTRNRKWAAMPVIVGGFLAMHGLQGWCPPVPILRRLGFRTPNEIERERAALLAMKRGFPDDINLIE